MSTVQLSDPPIVEDSEFVQFWHEVLAPKFIRFKHVLVDGLTQHSAAIFPSLPVHEGERVLDVGCGFGDTAIKLAERVGQQGEVVGIDCCDTFLDYARKDAESRGINNVSFMRVDAPVLVGHHVQDAIDFQLAIGPAGEVFREAGKEAEDKREEIEAALAEAINKQKIEAEGIVMDSSSWVISVTNPIQ